MLTSRGIKPSGESFERLSLLVTYLMFSRIRSGPEVFEQDGNVAQQANITIKIEKSRGPIQSGSFPNPLNLPRNGQEIIVIEDCYILR
jgi:hypothetical protein